MCFEVKKYEDKEGRSTLYNSSREIIKCVNWSDGRGTGQIEDRLLSGLCGGHSSNTGTLKVACKVLREARATELKKP